MLRPLGDRVLVEPLKDERAPTAMPSGLVTAASLAAAVTGEDARWSPFVGRVVALGPAANSARHEDTLTVGDCVVFSDEHGHQVQLRGVPYLILRRQDILARW